MTKEIRYALDWLTVNASANASADEALEHSSVIEEYIEKRERSISEALVLVGEIKKIVNANKNETKRIVEAMEDDGK